MLRCWFSGRSMINMRTLEFPLKALTFDTPAGVRASFPFQGSKINQLSEERNKASDAKLFVDQTGICVRRP